MNTLFQKLEQSAGKRNPTLLKGLAPGLPEREIREALETCGIEGHLDILITIYTWKNGSTLDAGPLEEASFFPESIYIFLSLEMALSNLESFTALEIHPLLENIGQRYFPVFWDYGNSYLMVDLKEGYQSRVMLLMPESDQPLQEAYSSFEEFLCDAVRANELNEPLKCFQI